MFGKLKETADTNNEMSFLGHLEALRWHLFRSAIAVMVIAVGVFFAKSFIFDGVLLAPKRADFFTYRLFCKFAQHFHLGDDFCIKEIPFKLQNIDLTGQFTTHMMVSLIAGAIIASPYIFWELWIFIKPALYEKERRYAKGIVFYTSALFIIGILFGYYMITPLSVNFLGTYQVSADVENIISLESFISMVTTMTLISGLIFELPIVVYFLTKVGILTPTFMRTYRKHAVVVILIAAADITPSSDIPTMMLVAMPLYILYEVSILVAQNVLKKANQ